MTRKGVWNLQQVRDKYLQSLWEQSYSLFMWSEGNRGQLGQNDLTRRSSPIQVPGTTWSVLCQKRSNLDDGTNTYFSIKDDGSLWSWGGNTSGVLGQSQSYATVEAKSSPTQVGSDTTWANVVTGALTGLGVKTDGTLWVWGNNGKGALGLNQATPTVINSPTQLPGTTWSTNLDHASGGVNMGQWIKTDGTLWMWGDNENGQLGQNSRTYYSSPVQIPGTDWQSIGGCRQAQNAIKTDGTMWGWGGEGINLGLNSTTNYSSPVQIPGTNWDLCISGASSGLGHKTDNTLWVWGNNGSGRLGLNQTDNTMLRSPVQIPGSWSKEFALKKNGECMFAIRTDGTFWAWGYNAYGQLGLNDNTNRSSPTQIPGTKWSHVACGGDAGAKAFKAALTPSQL